MTCLQVRDLATGAGERVTVDGASFSAEAGEFIGIVGPNGAGKTTLLRCLCGLLEIRRGEILLDGEALARLGDRRRAQMLAYLPQGDALHWRMSVQKVIALGRLPSRSAFQRETATDEAAVARAMASVAVTDFSTRPVDELSGGERRRVLLARALAVEAPILLVDEPVASLDPRHALEIMRILRRAAEAGTLVVAVMHDLALVARFCTRVLVLNEGRLQADGAPAAVLTPERIGAVYGVDPDDMSVVAPRSGRRHAPLDHAGEAGRPL